ncbi:MAG: hypothetical protein ACI9W2_004701 [Gammaproteobacteria bacterium]|jgi:uncharacterized protein YdbL (DUF1318 family)
MITASFATVPAIRGWLVLSLVVVLAACVTINVYFPAAEVQRAADRLIDEVWGTQGAPNAAPNAAPVPKVPLKPNAALNVPQPLSGTQAISWLMNVLIPSASAQVDLDVSTPAVNKLKGSMHTRHAQLAPHYDSGGVGLTEDGLVTEHDAKAIALQYRQAVVALIAAENRDREALYQEIARANGHPEWAKDVQSTFARQWIAKARKGWWYRVGGGWQQK